MQTSHEPDGRQIVGGLPAAPEGPTVTGPGAFNHPDQVVSASGLTKSQKRALLASWASDRRAVQNAPALRRLDSGAVVAIDDILEAMTALDGDGRRVGPVTPNAFAQWHTSRLAAKLGRRRTAPWTDRDDDPPPSAAAAARPFPPIFTEALAISA